MILRWLRFHDYLVASSECLICDKEFVGDGYILNKNDIRNYYACLDCGKKENDAIQLKEQMKLRIKDLQKEIIKLKEMAGDDE